MENRLLIGNIIVLLGSAVMVCVGFIKEKKKILKFQLAQLILLAIGNLVLRGYSGFIANIISSIRNIVCIKFNFNTLLKVIFITVQGTITLLTNTEGIYALLPFLGVFVYIAVFDTNDQRIFKGAMILSEIFWCLYYLTIKSYTGFVFAFLTCISNSIALYSIIKNKSY